MPEAARATAGNVAYHKAANGSSKGDTKPVAGNQERFNAKITTKIMAIQKLGNATPTEVSTITSLSPSPPAREAARMPSGTPTATESVTA